MLKSVETSGGEMVVQYDLDYDPEEQVKITEVEIIEVNGDLEIEIRRIEDDRTVTVRFV